MCLVIYNLIVSLMLFWSFIKKLNFKKSINFFKVLAGYWLSSIFKKDFYYGMPFSISVEPTTSCNLKCIECTNGQNKLIRPKGQIDVSLFKKIIDENFQFLLNCFIYFQGEPFLLKEIFELINYANRKKIFLSTSTNGHFFDDKYAENTVLSGIDKLIVSLDGCNQEIYQKYRVGGDFEKVVMGIEKLIFYKKIHKMKNPVVVIQFLVTSFNEFQMDDIKKLSSKLKADKLEYKSLQINDFENNYWLLPKNKKYRRYKFENGKLKLKNKLKNKCWRLWNSVVITWDGKVLPCCFDKNAEYILGDINTDTLNNIIHSKSAENFRQMVLSNRKSINICRNCTN